MSYLIKHFDPVANRKTKIDFNSQTTYFSFSFHSMIRSPEQKRKTLRSLYLMQIHNLKDCFIKLANDLQFLTQIIFIPGITEKLLYNCTPLCTQAMTHFLK